MASDIRIPDPVTIKKEEDEDSYLINEQCVKIQKEIYKMEEEKLDQLLNQPPGVGDFSFDTIDAELNDEIKTKDDEILVTSHLEQVGNEEKCMSDPCPTSIPKEDETEMPGNEKQFHKCDHTGDAKEREEYEPVVVDETCENSTQNIDEQEAPHDIKTSSPVSKVEEDIIVENEDSSKNKINVDQNVEEILDQQTFVDNNDKPQNINEERNGSELELKKEASAESTINIVNDDIETVTEITNAEDSTCSRGILDEEDVGMKTELKVGDCTEIPCDSKVEKATEVSRDTEIEKDEETSTSNADDVAMPEVQNDEVTMETGISPEAKLEMPAVSEDTDEGSKQEGTLEGVNLNGPPDEFTNQTETREESTQDNSIPNEGNDAEFSEQKLDSINVERQVDLQEMTESTTNESGEVKELTATATGDYIDGSQNTKTVQDLEHKYFKEYDPTEETTLVAVNEGLEENETETPREISETISNEEEKQITNFEKNSSGIEKEYIEAAYFGASKDDVPTEEELSPSNLNEVHDSANEFSDNNSNDVQLEHSLLQETEKVDDQKVDEVLEFENEQKNQEANNAMTEEEKYIDNVSEAYPNTENTTGEIESMDKTRTNEMISEINSRSVEDENVSGSGLEEKTKSSEIRVYVPEELDRINVEHQVDLQEITESTTNESREVEELNATATGDYIDGSQNTKAVQDLKQKYFKENDPAEKTILVALNEGLEDNETKTPREIFETISNEGEKQIANLEETSSSVEKEHIEAAYFGASKDDVSTEEELSPSNLNEVHDSANELSDNNGNDVQLEHSLLQETEKVEDQKVDEVLEFENEQKIKKANNVMKEEEKYVDNVSEAYPNTEDTTGEIESLDKTGTNEVISEIKCKSVEDENVSGSDLEEKKEISEIRVYVPEELDSINVERQVDLQKMTESITNESEEVEELIATATVDYIDGSQNTKAVKDLEHKYFKENDPAEETTLVAVNEGLEENETKTPREISETINNEGEKQIANLEETSSGIEKEHIEAAYFGASKDDVPTEEELSPSNLNEVHGSANELSDNNGSDVQLEHSLLQETEKVEDQRVDEVLEFENEQKIKEANNVMKEEEKYVDNVSEAYPNTEDTTREIESLDKTGTNEMISEINSRSVEDENVSGSGLEEKKESSEIRVYVPEELDSINVERQVDLQEMTESTTNESEEVEELTATATGDYIDGSQNTKAVKDLEHKYFKENDPAEETTLIAVNEGLEENETETPREISETINNEGEKQIANLDETSSGIEKEHIEAAYFGASKDDVPTEEELSPSNLNEVHGSANELSDNNGNDVQLEHSLLQETEKVDDQKVDEVLEFENEQKIKEANNAVTKEEKYVDNVSKAYPNTEDTTEEIESMDKTETNEMISEINSRSVEDENVSGSDLEEKKESSEIRVYVQEELDSINVERQVDLQEMIESTTNESKEVEELTATATDDYIDGSQNTKVVQDFEHKYFKENDSAEETSLVTINEGLEENETETPREISETISNEEEKQIANLEETSSGIEEEHIEAAYFGANKDDVPTKEELSSSNLNEVHDNANELSDNNGNDLQLEHSLLQETKKVEDEKVDEVLEFENEQKIREANNAMTEEEKYDDNVSEAYPNIEDTNGEIESLDKTVTNEVILEINSSNVEDEKISGSGMEEKIKSSEIKVYVQEEFESTKDTETSVQRSTIKGSVDNKSEEHIAVDDALTTESRNALIEEEIVEKSFEEQDYEEAALNLSGEDENLSPNEIEKKKTHDEEGSDNIDRENIKEEALVKSKDACFSPETNEVDGSSEKEVEKLKEVDSGRSILDEADEKYVGEEVIKHYEDENEDILISKGEIFCEVENATGETFITNEKNEDVETHDKCFNTFKTEEDVAFSEEQDLLAIKEASTEESGNDSPCPTKEVVADNIIDNTTENSERQAMVAEEVAEKVLDEGKSKEEPINFLVARESETETLSENNQIILAAEKDIKQIMQKHDSGGELMQPLVIDETETEVVRQNVYNETVAVEELEETKQTETEACFDSTVVSEKDTVQILQKDETSEEVKQLQFTNEIDEKASCDDAENETSAAREDVEQISHQEETKELELILETKKFESEESCGDTEIIKLEDCTEKDLLNEVTKESKASCGDIEITVPKEDEKDEKYVGEEVTKHYEDENENIQIAKGEIFCEVENVTGEKLITNEKNEDVETHDKCFNTFKTEEDVAFSEEQDLLAIKEASMEESRNDSTCPTKEVVADDIIDNTTENSERQAMVAEEVAEKVLDEGKSKEEPINFLVARESEKETLSENNQIILAAEKDIQQIMQKDYSRGELMQPLVIDETETEVLRQNVYNETLVVEELEETKQTETEACFDSTVVSEKDTGQILQKDETSEEVKLLQFTNEIDEKASCDDPENETSVAREDVEQISHQEETKEELEQLETKKFESEKSCRNTEIIKLEDYEEKDLLNEVTKESEASCRDIEITVPKEDAEQVLLKEAANDIGQPQAPNETETEVFSENVKEILAVEELQETKKIETKANSDSTMVAEKYTERSLEKVETSEEVQQLQLTNEIEEKQFCNDAEEILVAREDTAHILYQDEPKKELDHSEETQKIEFEEHCEDEAVIAPEEDTQPVVLKEVTKELDQSLVINEKEMDFFSGTSEIVVNEKDTKQISQNIESVEEFENVPETAETETEDNNPFITTKDTENLQKDETRKEVKELLLTSEVEAKTICEDDEKVTLVAEDDAERDTETNLQTHETKEEMVKLINANETETEVFHGDIETTLAEKDIDKICQKNESTEEIEQYLGIKESNTEGFGDSSGIAIDERNFEETLQKEESREELEQLQASKKIETEAEKVCGNTQMDTVMGERGSEEPFEIGESSEKFERSIVTPEPAVKIDVDEDIITSIGEEETAKKEVIEAARECHENVILDEINSIKSQSQETISEEITTKDFQNDGHDATGYKELEIEDVSSIEQENFKENTTATLSSTSINETITESSEKENNDTVELKQESQLEFKEQIEVQNSKEISADNIQQQEDPDTKALDEEIHIEEMSENLAQNFFSESKVNEEEMQEESQETEKADSSLVSTLSEEKISKEELEIKELSNEEGTGLVTSNINVEEETDSKSENEKDKDISIIVYETENQIEYETDDQVHPTTIKNDQEVIIEEATLHHTPDYKLADLSTLPSKELDTETTEASYVTENVTIDAETEDIINKEVENPLKEQEIENKLVQEADESFTQRDLSEMGSLDIVHNSAPSEVQQQRDEELHPPPEIDRRSAFDSNEVANLNKEELIDFEKQHEVIDDKKYLESEEAGEDDSKQNLHSEKSEDIEKLLESRITETEAFVAEKDTGEGHQETEVIETAGECQENVISDEIDSTKSRSQETVNDEITLEYFQKDETDAIGYKESKTEHTSLTEQENFMENTTAILSSMPINETTTESSENENRDALKLKQELPSESKEQIEVESWSELQKDLDTKEAINEQIHVEERSENVAQNLLSESKVCESETEEGTQEKEDSDSSFVSITERDLSEMGSDQKSAPSEVQKQRDPELHPSLEIDTSTSESNEVANLDKEELAEFQNQYEVVDDKNNLQSEELEEVIFENQYVVVDDKTILESKEAAKDDSKGILQNEKSMEEIEQLMETKVTETEALVAEKDTREGFQETEMGVAEKDTTEVLEHTEPCVVEQDSSASNEMGNMKKEELDFENEYEIVDDKNNLEVEGETSKNEEPSEQPNEHNATNLNSLNDQYSIGDEPASELNMTCTDFAETSRSIELEEATAAVEVVSQRAGHDDSTVQFNELPTKEVFDTNRTGKEAEEETMEDVDTIKINSPEITELDTFEKNFKDDQAKETNLESNIRIEPTEALNEETSNQERNENYVASFVSEVSDKEVKEVRKDELIIDDCKPSIANFESESSGLNVAESEKKDVVEDKTVLDSTAIDNKPESEQKDITDVGTMLDFSAEERRDNDIAAVGEGNEEGGEYEMEEKLGILTENTCTKEGNENLASTESKMPDQDFEEEISINDYNSPSAKFEPEDSSLKAPESKKQEAETKEDQSVMEIKPEDISILCKEKEEDTTTLVVEGIDNRDHDIEETTPTKVVVEENILTRSFDFRSDDNLPESVEIPSDKHQLVETKTTEKVEDIVVRDEASYGNFEPKEKLNTPAEDTCTKDGNENLNASIESKVFDEEIKEEIISKEEVSTSDFDSASTKFESGDLTLKVVESEEQKIQTINDQSAMEIKPEDNSILCKEIDDETTTLAVESMANQDHDIKETNPTKVIVEENILTRSFDFTSDSNLQETVEIPSNENQLIASETPEKVEKNLVRDEASYGNFEQEATSPTQTIEEKLDATIEGTCTKEGDENLVASPQSKVSDDEIKEIIGKEEISINDYDSPSTKFERKDLSLKVVESEEQELQTKEDQTTIDTKQEDEDTVNLAVESMDNKEQDIKETTSKEVVVDENVLIRSFDSTGDNLQDSVEISSDKHELIATKTTERVESDETEHAMEEVDKAVAEEAFLNTSSDTLNDNDCHDSFVVLSEEHLPTASEMIEEKVSKSGIDDSPDKFNELELSKGKVEISAFVGKQNDIIEQEDGYNFKDNTLDLGEEKAAIVFREGDQGQRKEVAEIKEKSLLEEKNVEIDDSSETLECATENEYEKPVEESIATENKVPSEEVLEQNKFKEDHYQILLNEDSKKEDVAEEINEPLKSTSEVYYQDVVKLSEVIDEGATEKEKADEHRTLEEVTKKESFTDEENNEHLKEEETEVDREIQEKTEAITKEKESRVDMLELEGPEISADDNIISKDIYQTKEMALEISGKKLNQTEEISEEGIKTRSAVGDPIVNFGPLTEPPIENEEQERQDAKEEDRELKEHEHGDSSKDNLWEVRAEESISTDLEKVVSAEHKQSSMEENEPVDRTMAENTKRTIKSEELQDEKIEGAHVGDSGTDEEKGDKHDKDEVSDAPVIVEASKDIDVKVGHKKSHNILSGVGSKVKHSLSKVKKAITGKSSHHKSESPK